MAEVVVIAVAGESRLRTLRLHRGPRPRLEPLSSHPGLPGCGPFAVDTDHDVVHVGYKGDCPGVATLHLDRATGGLTERSRTPVDAPLTYLSLTGGLLLGASYGGGLAATFTADPRGVGPERDRVTHRHPHCIVAAPTAHGMVAYVVALGEDRIAQYRLGADGSLTPSTPPSCPAPAGSGPRHALVSGGHLYVTTEFSGEVLDYRRDGDGLLHPAGAVCAVDPAAGLMPGALGADPSGRVWGSDLHRAGPWLVTAERSSSRLASLPLHPDGGLGPPVSWAAAPRRPRGFATSPDGRYVVAVGELADDAQLFALRPNGALSPVASAPVGAGATWVRILP